MCVALRIEFKKIHSSIRNLCGQFYDMSGQSSYVKILPQIFFYTADFNIVQIVLFNIDGVRGISL